MAGLDSKITIGVSDDLKRFLDRFQTTVEVLKEVLERLVEATDKAGEALDALGVEQGRVPHAYETSMGGLAEPLGPCSACGRAPNDSIHHDV